MQLKMTKQSCHRRLQRAAGRGLKGGILLLGYCYQEGWYIKQNYKKAVYWYSKAINKREPIAFLFLGQLYQDGHGVKKDGRKAARLFRKALKMGVSAATYHIANLYDYGSTNFRRNRRLAIYWYRKTLWHKGYKGKLAQERLAELIKPMPH